jgi:hypothetical protein
MFGVITRHDYSVFFYGDAVPSKLCIPYNLVYRTGVLYPVPRPSDMIGRGLVRKTGLIKVVGAQDHVGAYEPCA